MDLNYQDYLFCLLGWIILNLMLWTDTKNEFDKLKKEYSFKEYRKANYDDWLFSLVAAWGLLETSPEVFIIVSSKYDFMNGIFWHKLIPLLIGFAGSFVFQNLYIVIKIVFKAVVEKIKKLIEKWKD